MRSLPGVEHKILSRCEIRKMVRVRRGTDERGDQIESLLRVDGSSQTSPFRIPYIDDVTLRSLT